MLTVRLFQSRSAYKLLYHHSNVIFYLTLTQNYPQMGPYVRLHTLSVRHRARLLDYTSEITYTNSRCGLVLPHCRHEGRVGGQVLLQTPTNLAYIINDRRGRTLLKILTSDQQVQHTALPGRTTSIALQRHEPSDLN